MKPLHFLTTAFSLVALQAGLTSPARAQTVYAVATPRVDLNQGVYVATIEAEDRSLRRYAGQKLLNTEGAELGTIKDFIVNPATNRVHYLVVSSGGVLGSGMGNSLRLVPIEAVRRGTRRNAFEVDILQSAWLQYPPVSDQDYVVDRFAIQPPQHDGMVQRFGPGNLLSNTVARVAPNGDPAVLIRASVLRGKAVRAFDRKVGDIENIILDLDRAVAAALLDASGDFTGTTGKYLLPLNRLVFTHTRQDPITTNLTRADFDRATPAAFSAAAVAVNPPRAVAPAPEPVLTPTGPTTTYVNVPVVTDDPAAALLHTARQAIISDPALVNQNVHLSAERGRIVLRGTTRTETARRDIENAVRRAAPTATVDNQITVVR